MDLGIDGLWTWYYWKQNTTYSKYIDDFMKDNYGARIAYQDFASLLHMEFFNASEVANTIAASGAK